MAFWAAAIPAAASLVSGYLNKKGADKINQGNKNAAQNAERARQEAKGALTNRSVYDTSEFLFPGLLPEPTSTGFGPSQNPGGGQVKSVIDKWAGYREPGTTRQAQEPGPGPSAGVGKLKDLPVSALSGGIWSGRADGGMVETGEDYTVGEEGPEQMIPAQDGLVIPNEGSVTPGGDTDMTALAQALGMAILQMLSEGGAAGGLGQEMAPSLAGPEGMGAPGMPMMGGPEGPPMGGGMSGEMGGGMGEMEGPPMGMPGLETGGLALRGQETQVGEGGQEDFVPLPGAAKPAQPAPPAGGVATATGQALRNGGAGAGSAAPGGGGAGPLGPQNYEYLGEAAVGRNLDMANNPGQLSSVPYERAQEQSNRGLNTANMQTMGQLGGAGVSPDSEAGLAVGASNAMTAGAQRTEAARDYSLASEAMAREDIQRVVQNYIAMLGTTFGLSTARAGAAGGNAFPQTQTVDPYGGAARASSSLGYNLAEYFKNRSTQNAAYQQRQQDAWDADFTGPVP